MLVERKKREKERETDRERQTEKKKNMYQTTINPTAHINTTHFSYDAKRSYVERS